MYVRNEYPRPQFRRKHWLNLNGEWDFTFDDANEGVAKSWFDGKTDFERKITVPFVYQSKASGIEDKSPHDIIWYKKRIQVEHQKAQQVILHFGAVDYEADIYFNGCHVKNHIGGHTSFEVNVTPYLKEGEEQMLVVRVYDPHEDETIPRGKQFWEAGSRSIWYTNSAGIWQTVWMEVLEEVYLDSIRFTSLFDDRKIQIEATLNQPSENKYLSYRIMFQNIYVAGGTMDFIGSRLMFDVDLIQEHIFRMNFHNDGWTWTPENPNLFQVYFELKDNAGLLIDEAESYFGFRKVHIEDGMTYLNNKPYYQKLVLDQGYWPDSLLTAPSDEDFVRDIELAKEMGFNGCRKHQKTEDPRFLYWADQLGFLVWGECAAPPMYSNKSVERLMREWTEIIERDYSHPSIVVWVPINESWGVPDIHNSRRQQHFSQTMYHYLHSLDVTRLVISNDGWEMTETDICAIHNYCHGYKHEKEKYLCYKETLATVDGLINQPSTCWNIYAKGFSYQGEPIMLTEFGGIGFDVSGETGWGYTSVETEEDYLSDYKRIMTAVYASNALWGYCYTQLTDVEQEINGLLTYHRKPKCDLTKIREINDGYRVERIFRKG